MKSTLAICAPTAVVLTALAGHPAADGEPTKLLRMPTVSATQIAFAYANNIWTVDRGGGMARRLTSFQGQTTNPHFSPDGKWIAFSGEYAGNVDVYVVSSEGGEPKRLTWHPGADIAQGWTPDGKAIMFASARALHHPDVIGVSKSDVRCVDRRRAQQSRARAKLQSSQYQTSHCKTYE